MANVRLNLLYLMFIFRLALQLGALILDVEGI